MSSPKIDLSFPHNWTAEVLDRRPMILPARHFVYPALVEEVERGALEILVRSSLTPDADPVTPSNEHPAATQAPTPFLATCALGFADPAVPSGVWSCPHPAWLCAVAGGYAYCIDTNDPMRWQQVEYRPVLDIRPLVAQGLLLFAGHHSLTAWGAHGMAWQSARLSWEGIQILNVQASTLTGTGWDLMSDRDVEFSLDLRTGEHTGGIK